VLKHPAEETDSGIHLGGEPEQLRRQVIGQSKTIDMLRGEVKQMQEMLHNSYKRIAELNTEINEFKGK